MKTTFVLSAGFLFATLSAAPTPLPALTPSQEQAISNGLAKVKAGGLSIQSDPTVVAAQPDVQKSNKDGLVASITGFKFFDNLRNNPTGIKKIAEAADISQLKGTGDENLEALANNKDFKEYFEKTKKAGDAVITKAAINSATPDKVAAISVQAYKDIKATGVQDSDQSVAKQIVKTGTDAGTEGGTAAITKPVIGAIGEALKITPPAPPAAPAPAPAAPAPAAPAPAADAPMPAKLAAE